MKLGLIALSLLISSLSFAHQDDTPPELWSWFKDLNKSKEACEIQSSYILKDLNLENQIENKYGIYGNVKSNRVVVKCIEMTPVKSKLLVAVAGRNRDSVELIRNKIFKLIN